MPKMTLAEHNKAMELLAKRWAQDDAATGATPTLYATPTKERAAALIAQYASNKEQAYCHAAKRANSKNESDGMYWAAVALDIRDLSK